MIEVLYEHWSARMTDNRQVKKALEQIRHELSQHCSKDVCDSIMPKLMALTNLTDHQAFTAGFIYSLSLYVDVAAQSLQNAD